MRRQSRAGAPRCSRRIAGGVALFLLLLGLWPSAGWAEEPSSYSSADHGTKALYLLLKDLGYRAERVFDASELDQRYDAALTLSGEFLGDESFRPEWVSGGKLLLVVPAAKQDSSCEALELGAISIGREKIQRPADQVTSHGLTFKGARCRFTSLPSSATPLAGSGDSVLAFDLSWGEGRFLVLADEALVSNLRLDQGDLAVVIRRWLARHCPAGGRIALLEPAHGGKFWETLGQAGLAPFALHGLLFLGLLYWNLSRRFGDPAAGRSSSRRAFALHARALGNLYQHRGASAHALKMQYQRFLTRIFGGSGGGDPQRGREAEGRLLGKDRAAVAALIATRTGRDADGVESLLAQIEYTLKSQDSAESRDLQKHLRLGKALAALDSAQPGGQRGPSNIR